ncbi:hypothetical protein [Ottowia thiooxydans]|uniref:hypothetical protein n=1 Tax=Ottowia thiooxydans TaxID=219182 RepID=UPI0012EC16AF|nr:hypothetical protein [Ottowia thiooxydans]
MPNAALNPAALSHSTQREPEARPFHRYLMGSEEDGKSLLPAASHKTLNARRDVEFDHPRYGRVKATYLCYSYKHGKERFYRWEIESAEQLDPEAPRPIPGQSGNPNIHFYAYGEQPKSGPSRSD